MTSPSRVPERGRPPRVTPERITDALLEIRGREPTLAELAERLDVGRATLYGYLRGQNALRRFAQNAVLECWELSVPAENTHWAEWARDFAWEVRDKLAAYPYLSDVMSGIRADLPGQVSHTERVMTRMVELGLPHDQAFLLLRSLIVLVVGLHAQPWGSTREDPGAVAAFVDWVRVHPAPVPTLTRLLESSQLEGGDRVFDELLGFLLKGMADRRGERLREDQIRRRRRPLPRAS